MQTIVLDDTHGPAEPEGDTRALLESVGPLTAAREIEPAVAIRICGAETTEVLGARAEAALFERQEFRRKAFLERGPADLMRSYDA